MNFEGCVEEWPGNHMDQLGSIVYVGWRTLIVAAVSYESGITTVRLELATAEDFAQARRLKELS